MVSILIVDDEPLARSRLKRMVDDLDGYVVCGEAENGREALERVASLRPDIVLLDIRMPGMDGMEAARQISALEHAPALIFCTAYEDYAVEAFQVQAIGYLVKPVRKEALAKALAQSARLNRVQQKTLETLVEVPVTTEYYLARTIKGEALIDLSRIFFFQADHKYLTVVHAGGETLSDGTLKEIERQYPETFLRIHRATLVNKRYVESLEKAPDGGYWVRLKSDKGRLPVSRRHVSDVRQWLRTRENAF